MTLGQVRYNLGYILCFLFLFGLGTSVFSQSAVPDNPNVYKHVTFVGSDYVIVDNTVDFSKYNVNDTVLLIQMKGFEIRVDDNSNYGTETQSIGSVGRYEFLIVQSTTIGTSTIKFRRFINNTYDPAGDVQLIRVPSFYDANVGAGGIKCQAWDSTTKTGGVLALIVGKTLRLNGNIDVSGKGFKGAVASAGTGVCTTISNSNHFFYDTSFKAAGLKGEGIVTYADTTSGQTGTTLPIYPLYAKGKGSNFNGGGGGNGRFSGGGGGANMGDGGRGGSESCSSNPGGLGGLGIPNINYFDDSTRIFMGGGGGGSTRLTAGAGGRGGGIVFILCKELDGPGSILANGQDGFSSADSSGAGGGGGGGSIALYLENVKASFSGTLTANGGKGGNANTSYNYGEGGGGGGGLVWLNKSLSITKTLNGGGKGTGGANSHAGYGGTAHNNFVPVLNGFLFNTIQSSVTGSLADSVCSNMLPPRIDGTLPVGGSGNYVYLWQKRNYGSTNWNDISPSNVLNYTFPAFEADTFEIRRVVRDNISSLTDTCKQALIIVQPRILNNLVNIQSDIIGPVDTVCHGQDPKIIDQAVPDLWVPTTKYLYYYWQDSTSSGTWGTTLATTKFYDPNPSGGLTTDTWYRRKVISGRCADSTAKVKFRVFKLITGDSISAAQEICHGGTFVNLLQKAGYTLAGGDTVNGYIYLWQSSPTGAAGSWSSASGTNNTSGYDPVESGSDTETKTYYRRMVYSGSHNVCKDSTNVKLLTEWKKISNNTILPASQTICSGNTPVNITGSSPADGNHSYTELWLQKTRLTGYTTAAGPNATNQLNYQPPSLTDTTWYRRYVTSSTCADTSAPVAVNVHKPISNNKIALRSAVFDTTLCVNQPVPIIKGADPSGGTNNPLDDLFQWQVSTPGNNSWVNATGSSISIDYSTGSLANATANPLMYYFRRSFTSGMCSTFSDTVTVRVLSKITNNVVSADQAICYNTTPANLTGVFPSGGESGSYTWKWQQSTDGGVTWSTAVNPSSQNYTFPGNLTAPTRFRRWVYSGLTDCCIDSSNFVSISINPLPIGVISAATDTICEGTSKPLSLTITGSIAAPWNVKYNENHLKLNSSTQSTVSESSSSSTILVTPAIASSTTDSAAYSYTLFSIQDANGCFATSMSGVRKLVIYKVPVPNAYSDTSVCGPKATIRGATNVGSGKWWYVSVAPKDSVVSGNSLTVTIDSTKAGTNWPYTFTWHVVNWNCPADDSKLVTFYKRASLADAGKDDTLYTQTMQFQLNGVPPLIGKGTWYSVASGDSVAGGLVTDLSPGVYVFEWRVVNGACQTSDQMKLFVNNIFIPDGFSPNGDGVNDVFEILGLDTSKSEVSLTVFNSAGSQVYHSTNSAGTYTPWNGENEHGPLPDGIYYYIVTIKTDNPVTLFKKSGFVIIKRDKD